MFLRLCEGNPNSEHYAHPAQAVEEFIKTHTLDGDGSPLPLGEGRWLEDRHIETIRNMEEAGFIRLGGEHIDDETWVAAVADNRAHHDGSELWCDCGNIPSNDGFDPCLPDGTVVEPLVGVWESWFKCIGCGLVFDDDAVDEKPLPEEFMVGPAFGIIER